MNETAESYLARTGALVEEFARADLARWRTRGGRALEPALAAAEYSLLAGGKRLRPALVLAAGEALQPGAPAAARSDLLAVAAAFEYIHTYSLMHDDLPVMDNDALRRGRPACHVAHGVPAAVRGGLLLIAMAFAALARTSLARRPEIIRLLEEASGLQGMVGGQALDILGENRPPDPEELIRIHRGKTAALIRGAMLAGALAAEAAAPRLVALTAAGEAVGLAFQIVDDLLDVHSTPERMGKPTGADSGKGKRTYPAVLGAVESEARAASLIAEAEKKLREAGVGESMLSRLVDFVLRRAS